MLLHYFVQPLQCSLWARFLSPAWSHREPCLSTPLYDCLAHDLDVSTYYPPETYLCLIREHHRQCRHRICKRCQLKLHRLHIVSDENPSQRCCFLLCKTPLSQPQHTFSSLATARIVLHGDNDAIRALPAHRSMGSTSEEIGVSGQRTVVSFK